MPSNREYLGYVLEQLSALDGVSYRAMMGEYVLYYRGKVVGGVYDDRLLLKPTKTALWYMREAVGEPPTEIPYEFADVLEESIVFNTAENGGFSPKIIFCICS